VIGPGVVQVSASRAWNAAICTLSVMIATEPTPVHKADIACRRLAELSRSVTRHHRRIWQARCPTGQTRQLSPGLRDVQQRYDAVIGTRPPKRSWSCSFAPGDTFLTGTPVTWVVLVPAAPSSV
jgi:hypothetical protein